MLTLLASHPPHPSPAQQCDSSIIHFNSKIKQAASNLSLHPFCLNTAQCVDLSVCVYVDFVLCFYIAPFIFWAQNITLFLIFIL